MSAITSNEHFLIRNRNLRNELLKKTDYLMMMDVYETLDENKKQELRTYRQTLRDFINQNKDNYLEKGMWNIAFPPIPEWLNLTNPKY